MYCKLITGRIQKIKSEDRKIIESTLRGHESGGSLKVGNGHAAGRAAGCGDTLDGMGKSLNFNNDKSENGNITPPKTSTCTWDVARVRFKYTPT